MLLASAVTAVPLASQRVERAVGAEGPSEHFVLDVVSDFLGFAWIATQNGILRYDGTDFEPYGVRTLSDRYIRRLHHEGSKLWAGSYRGGLHLIDPSSGDVTNYGLEELGRWRVPGDVDVGDQVGRSVHDLKTWATDTLIVGTDRGIVLFDTESGQITWRGEVDQAVQRIVSLPDRSALVGFLDGSLQRIDRNALAGSTPQVAHLSRLPSAMTSSSIGVMGEGRILIGTRFNGIFEVDLADSLPEVRRAPDVGIPANAQVLDMLGTRRGELVVGTFGELYIDSANDQQVVLSADDPASGLPHQNVYSLAEDRDGGIWVGTWRGLGRISALRDAVRLVDVRPDDLKPTGQVGVMSVARLQSGALAAGTDGFGLLIEQLEESRFERVALGDGGSSRVYDITLGEGAETWIAAFDGGVFRLASPRATRAQHVPGTDRALSLLVEEPGKVWVGTQADGLLALDRGTGRIEPHAFPGDFRLGSPYVWSLSHGLDGSLWIGAFESGVARISNDGTARLYQPSNSQLTDNRIITVFHDREGGTWIGTEGGGLHWLGADSADFRVFQVADGLPDDNVMGILEDDQGHIWVSTLNGLARLNPDTGRFWTLKTSAGLPSDRFFANSTYFDEATRRLYFGTVRGLVAVEPALLRPLTAPPPVALTRFSVHGEPRSELNTYSAGSGITLESFENFFSLDFAALDFADVTLNRYRYKLEGLHDDWIDAGSTGRAIYTSVPPNDYVFRVAGRNAHGVWNEEGLAIPITVLTPYYATWWFRALILALLGVMLVALYAYRVRQILRVERMRFEFAGRLHDDIGANLSTIAMKSDVVRTADHLDERRRLQLAEVSRIARATTQAVREMVWVTNAEYDTLHGLIRHIRDSMDDVLGTHVRHELDLGAGVTDRPIKMDVRRNLHLLVKEALHNSLKHAKATEVSVRLRYSKPWLHASVEDDGQGFDPSAADQGNGLGLMRRRADEIKATLGIESVPGEGTRIEIRVKLR